MTDELLIIDFNKIPFRVCKKCNIVKEIILFQKIIKKGIYSYRHTCIDCYKKHRKEYNNKKRYNKRKKD